MANMATALAPAATRSTAATHGVLLDGEAFGQLYSETFSTIYRYIFARSRDASRTEDIVAETYLRAWRARSTYRGDGPALSWLLAIAHHCGQDHFRRHRETTGVEALANHADPAAGPSDLLQSAADAGRLRQAIPRLTPEQQQVVIMRFFEGLPPEAVGARLGRTSNAVRAIQFRALGRLRKLLEAS